MRGNSIENWFNISPTPWQSQLCPIDPLPHTLPTQPIIQPQQIEPFSHNRTTELVIQPHLAYRQSTQETGSSRSSKVSFSRKRVPRTTAKRKGLVLVLCATVEHSETNNEFSRVNRRRIMDGSLGDDEDIESFNLDDEDDIYYPPDSEVSDTDESVVDEDADSVD